MAKKKKHLRTDKRSVKRREERVQMRKVYNEQKKVNYFDSLIEKEQANIVNELKAKDLPLSDVKVRGKVLAGGASLPKLKKMVNEMRRKERKERREAEIKKLGSTLTVKQLDKFKDWQKKYPLVNVHGHSFIGYPDINLHAHPYNKKELKKARTEWVELYNILQIENTSVAKEKYNEFVKKLIVRKGGKPALEKAITDKEGYFIDISISKLTEDEINKSYIIYRMYLNTARGVNDKILEEAVLQNGIPFTDYLYYALKIKPKEVYDKDDVRLTKSNWAKIAHRQSSPQYGTDYIDVFREMYRKYKEEGYV